MEPQGVSYKPRGRAIRPRGLRRHMESGMGLGRDHMLSQGEARALKSLQLLKKGVSDWGP